MLRKPNLGGTGLALVAALFIGILLLANHLLRGAKLDLTADNLYTIADGTETKHSNINNTPFGDRPTDVRRPTDVDDAHAVVVEVVAEAAS